MDASELLQNIRLMPVVVIDDDSKAVQLAETLLAAGIGAIEITLRTAAALAAIEQVARAVPDIILGAGSIRNPEQFQSISDAGAHFAVSPGHSKRLLEAANMPYLPGAATPSECMGLLEHGYRLQKFFPAEQSGGLAKIKAMSAPLPEARFCPTGGITAANARDYLACPAVACIGGSWFVPGDALRAGDFKTIAALSKEASLLAE
jgi:2-dehydro-3-deoxyphosphogluconate aldolase/(4S)-4-hydroxy-2-oxoglutarate aldolase